MRKEGISRQKKGGGVNGIKGVFLGQSKESGFLGVFEGFCIFFLFDGLLV